MSPRLIAISGSFEGQTFALDGDEVSIGRDGENGIRIRDRSISRRHCLIKKEDENFTISDFESFNGTFVNGAAIKKAVIKHGDQITLGDILFLFLEHENQPIPDLIELKSELTPVSTIRLERKDAMYFHPSKFLTNLISSDERKARNLSALLDLNIEIGKLRNIESLQKATLTAIFAALPVQRGAIILLEENIENITATFTKTTVSSQKVNISRTIAEQVIKEKTAMLCTDIETNSAYNQAESLITAETNSLICVPLTIKEKIAGIIYIDTDNAARNFDEDHLQFSTAVAGIVSIVLENIKNIESLKEENNRLRQEINLEHNMIGESQPMQKVFRFIEKAAPTDATFLIRGESGTGKELVARAIHENSQRKPNAFIAINCAVLSENLLESELFGHEKGAFTTAVAQKKGKIELADGGTLFLDEIGEMSPAMQAKLLRVLQEREFERVGGVRTIKVDARIIAATNRNLEDEIKTGNFREDLYYRLNVVSLKMPPLRERSSDILPLAEYFAEKYSRKCNRSISGFSREAQNLLSNYDFPGNVRELENAVERAIVLGSSALILPEDLPESIIESNSQRLPATNYQAAVNEMKKNLIVKTLDQTNGNYTEAAGVLGLHPTNLHRLIRTMNIKHLLK